MVLTPVRMLPLERRRPDFTLPDTEGDVGPLRDFKASPALLVMFIATTART
jgi:peroxiredoxin